MVAEHNADYRQVSLNVRSDAEEVRVQRIARVVSEKVPRQHITAVQLKVHPTQSTQT